MQSHLLIESGKKINTWFTKVGLTIIVQNVNTTHYMMKIFQKA